MPDEEMPDVRRMRINGCPEFVRIFDESESDAGAVWLTRRQAEYVQDELARILAEDWS